MNAAAKAIFILLWLAGLPAAARRPTESFATPFTASASVAVTKSWYDPQVEFLEVAAAYQGRRTWLVHGPDLDGRHGGLQGTGGFERTVRESDAAALLFPLARDPSHRQLPATS